jgi:hypothetical protein
MATRNDLLRERVELISKIKDLQKSEGIEAAKLTKEYVKLKGELTNILTTLNDSRVQSEEMLSGMKDTRDTTASLGGLYKGITSSMTEQLRLQRNVTDIMSLQSTHSNNVYNSLDAQTDTISDILSSYSTLSDLSTEMSNIGEKDVSRYNDILDQMDVERSKIGEQLNLLGDKSDLAKEFLQINNDLADTSKLQVDEALRLSSISKSGDSDIALSLQESLNSKITEQAVLQEKANQLGLSHLMNIEESKSTLDSQHLVLSSINDSYNAISQSASELSQTSVEDIQSRLKLQTIILNEKQSISEQVALLDDKNEASKMYLDTQSKLNQSIEFQIQKAEELSLLSEKEHKILEGQSETYDMIRDKVDSIGSTLSTFLKRPQAAIGAMVIGFGAVVNKIGDANKELGTSMFQSDGVGRKAGILSLFFDDAVQNAADLSKELGGTDAATMGLQTNVGLMSKTMGISGTEAATLIGSFSRLNKGSTSVASDMVATSNEFAKQNNIIPSQLMSELAGSAEEFALFGKEGGKNILEAAGYASKLGVGMSTISGIADGLLDFESSITKELELGALLGKNINLNKARQLAYDGKLKEATAETLKQLGGVAAFNKMDYFQKKASAEMLGVSVAEMQKMVTNQEKAGELSTVVGAKFSKWGSTLDAGLNAVLGTGLEGIGGMITMSGELGKGFESLSAGAKGIGGAFSWAKKSLGGVGKAAETATDIGNKAAEGAKLAETTSDVVPKGGVGGGLKSMAEGLSEMGTGKVLFGALNLIPTSVGMIAILPGLPGMAGISLLGKSAGEGLVSLGEGLESMGTGKVTFGSLNLIPAAIGMAIMTAGIGGMMVVAGFGMAAGEGLVKLGEGLESMGTGKVLLGALNLIPTGIGMALMTLGAVGLGAIALLGVPAGIGLVSIAKGMAQLGNGKVILGSVALILLAGGLTLMGYAMGLFAQNASGILPAIGALVAFGIAAAVIGSFVGLILLGALGIAALGASLIIFGLGIQSISNGLIPVLEAVSNSGEMAGSLLTVGLGLLSLAAGFVALGLAAPFAFLAMIPLMLLSGIGSKLEESSAGFASVGEGLRDIMSSVTPEGILNLFSLGPALLSAALGLVAFSVAMLAASAGDGISSLFGGGIMDTLSELSELSPKLVLVATALTAIGTSLGLIITNLDNLNLDKLNELSDITIPEPDIPESIGEVVVPTKVDEIPDTDIPESIGEVVVPTKVEEIPDTDIQASVAPDMTGIENAIPEGLTTTLSSISEMAPNLTLTAAALSEMGIALGLISTNLATIDTEKLTALSDFSISPSIGTAVTGIADSISGVIDSVSGVVGGETLSEYETQMMAKMDTLIAAVSTGRDVYMDKEKVTNVVMKMSERSSKNMFGLENA